MAKTVEKEVKSLKSIENLALRIENEDESCIFERISKSFKVQCNIQKSMCILNE